MVYAEWTDVSARGVAVGCVHVVDDEMMIIVKKPKRPNKLMKHGPVAAAIRV